HEQHNHALDNHVELGRQTAHQNGGGQALDDEDADDGQSEIEAAAGQRAAADHHGKDRVELDEQASVVAVRTADISADQHARDARAQPGQRIGADLDQPGVDSGKIGRGGIAAD